MPSLKICSGIRSWFVGLLMSRINATRIHVIQNIRLPNFASCPGHLQRSFFRCVVGQSLRLAAIGVAPHFLDAWKDGLLRLVETGHAS